MTLTEAEQQFLMRQERGHLTTIGSDGWPQVKPLGFSWNAEIIRIHPTRVIGWNISSDGPVFEARNVTDDHEA